MSNGDSLDFTRKYIDKKNVFKRNENNYGKIYFVSMVNKQKIENNIIYSFNSNFVHNIMTVNLKINILRTVAMV